MRKLLALAALALLFPGAAPAKWVGDLRMCGADRCVVVERHLAHDADWRTLAALNRWPSSEGPARPGPFYRLTIVSPDGLAESPPIYFVPNARLARNDDGWGSVFWTRVDRVPESVARAARRSRPLPAPRLTQVLVGNRVAEDPHSYLRLYRLPAPNRRVRDPAGRRPQDVASTQAIASYWERVGRIYQPIRLSSRRDSPWTDDKSWLWIGRKLDVIMRDGEIVPIANSLAERIRRAQSLR